MTLGLALGLARVTAFVSIVVRVVVFVFLALFLLGILRLNLIDTRIARGRSALVGAVLCSWTLRRSTRDHETREGNTEHPTYENIQFHFFPSVSEHIAGSLLDYGQKHASKNEAADTGL